MKCQTLTTKVLVHLLGGLIITISLPSLVSAYSSEKFFQRGDEVYDHWGISRTRAQGSSGFLQINTLGFHPTIVYESTGDNVDSAWELGRRFAQRYVDEQQRAEAIFYFVRDSVRYTSDSDQFGLNEFAQNADELTSTIDSGRMAQGDCEDSAILLAVLYRAAGYRSAMALMPGHVATLVYLPEYSKAPRKFTFAGESGWVWAEATGATNPFGWAPASLSAEDIIVKEIKALTAMDQPPEALQLTATAVPASTSRAHSGAGFLGFIVPAGLLWLMTTSRKRT